MHLASNWSDLPSDSWVYTSGEAAIANATAGALLDNTIKFDSSSGTGFSSPKIDFNTLKLGGIIVTNDAASTYTLTPSAADARDIVWGQTDATDLTGDDYTGTGALAGYTNFIIDSDFQIGTDTLRVVSWVSRSGGNFNIASGAELSVYAQQFDYVGSSKSGSGGFTEPTTPFEQIVQGGGTLMLDLSSSYDLSRGLSWSIRGGDADTKSTLDLSAMSAGTTATFGSLDLSDGGIIDLGANAVTLDANLTSGAGGGVINGSGGVTLTGDYTLSATSGSLTLQGGAFTLADDFIIYIDSALDLGNYTIFDTTSATLTNSTLDNVVIRGLSGRASYDFVSEGNSVVFKYLDTANPANLTWAGGNETWVNEDDTNSVDWITEADGPADKRFHDLDSVTFSDDTGGTITISGDVLPTEMTVSGTGHWIFEGSGSIVGNTTNITISGGGIVELNTVNSFGGDITLSDRTLSLGVTGAAGTAAIKYNSGTIQFTSDSTFTNTLEAQGGATTLNLDVVGSSNVTWLNANVMNLNLSNSNYTTTNSTFNTGGLNGRTVSIGEGVTLSTNASAGGVTISGAGTFSAQHSSGNLFVNGLANFTGTLKTADGKGGLTIIHSHNSDAGGTSRFFLETSSSASGLNTESIVLSNNLSGKTLYLSGLTGYGNISTAYNTASSQRHIDILMSEDNTYHGHFYDAGYSRLGKVTIGGDATFYWTGETRNENDYASMGTNASILIKAGATMDFATNDAGNGGGQWADDIAIEEGGTLRISRSDGSGFVQQVTGNAISGGGTVEVTGKATLNGTNTHASTTVKGSNAVLSFSGDAALGSGAVNVSDNGTLKFANESTTSKDIIITSGGKFSGSAATDVITLTGDISAAAKTTLELSLGAYTVSDATISNLNIDALETATLNLNSVRLENGVTFSDAAAASTTLTNVTIAPTGITPGTADLTTQQLSGKGSIHNEAVTVYTLAGVDLADTIEGTLTFDLSAFTTEATAIMTAIETGMVGIEIAGVTSLPDDFWYNNVQFILSGETTVKALGVATKDGSVNLFFVVPEPSTTAMSLIALASLLARRRRQPQSVA